MHASLFFSDLIMTMFLQYTISFMLLSMVIGASYYGVDDYELDNDGDDARNEEREAGGCKYPGRACSAGGWYSYGCYFSHDRIGGIKMVSTILRRVLFYARAKNSNLATSLILLDVSFTATESKFMHSTCHIGKRPSLQMWHVMSEFSLLQCIFLQL